MSGEERVTASPPPFLSLLSVSLLSSRSEEGEKKGWRTSLRPKRKKEKKKQQRVMPNLTDSVNVVCVCECVWADEESSNVRRPSSPHAPASFLPPFPSFLHLLHLASTKASDQLPPLGVLLW